MIIVPYRITEKFIRDHPELTFIYSSDTRNKGGLGMQWFIAGPANSFPVPVLFKFCANPEYFRDEFHDFNKKATDIIDEYLSIIPKNKPIIVPPKIGLGCARMLEYCPITYEYLRMELNKIMSHDFKIDYTNIY